MRRTFLLLCLLFPAAAHADDGATGQLRGTAAFDGGRGHVTLGGGYETFGVEAIATGLVIGVDTDYVLGKTDDRVDGSLLDGRLSYILPGETEPTWFGRNTRLVLDIAHGWGDREQVVVDTSRTASTGLSFLMSSGNGRAFAYAGSSIFGVSAFTAALGTDNTFTAFCSQTNGTVFAQAVANGTQNAAGACGATPTVGTSSSQSADAGVQYAADAHAVILSGTPFDVLTVLVAQYDIEDTRGEASMSGDYELAPSLTLSPSFALVAGRRQQKFIGEKGAQASDGATDFAVFGVVRGSLTSKDMGLQGGSQLTYELMPGLDLFVSAKAALIHRRTELQSLDGVLGVIDGASVGIGVSTLEESREHTAFQGGLEIGGSYTFGEGLGLGPLRAALNGGLRYDTAVASYRGVHAAFALDPPYPPAGIDFGSETDFFLKAGLTLELP